MLFKRKLFLFILFLVFSVKAFSQQFYACDEYQKLALVTITSTGPQYQYVQGCGDGSYYSIAILGTKLYYIDQLADMYSADIITGAAPAITNCKKIASNVGSNALTVDTKGILYFVNGSSLYSINSNIANSTPVLLGTMPYFPEGDLVFYNNQLYMAAPEGIVKIDLGNPALSTLAIPTPDVSIYGLANVLVNGKNILYALVVGDQPNATEVVQLNMLNMTVVGSIGSVPFVVYDAASVTEAGVVQRINISSFNVTQECNAYNESRIAVVCTPNTDQYTFTLNNGQSNTTGIFDNLSPGPYQLDIKSSGPQVVTDTAFTIPDYTANNPAITETQINPLCNTTGQIKLDMGASDALYNVQFQNNIYSFDHTFTGLSAGSYTFTILNTRGCITDQKSYSLVQQTCPPVAISSFIAIQQCDAFNQGQVTIACAPTTNQYTFTLSNGQTNTSGQFTNLAPGNYQLNITSNGNQSPKDTTFTVPDYTANNPAITETQLNPVCSATGQIKLDAGVSDALYSVQFQNNIYSFDHTFTGLGAGSYTFIILNTSGCIIDQKSYSLVQQTCPYVAIGSFNLSRQCDVFNQGQVTIVCSPTTDQYTFTLSNGQTNTNGQFTNLAPGNYQLNITTNGGQLPKDTTFTVPDFTLSNPTINARLKNPICNLTGTIKLDVGSAAIAYNIEYGNNTFGFDHSFTGLAAGTYHFTIVTLDGCIIDEKDYTLTQDICPPITIGNIEMAPECTVYGQASVTITTQPHPDQYTYTLNNVSDTTGVFDFVPPGTYDLVITSSGGDKLEQQLIVPDYTLDKPDITIDIKSVECEIPGSVKISSNGDSKDATTVTHGADIFPFNSTINNLGPGINYFSIFNRQGCIIDTLAVDIPQVECYPVNFPNAFTPNGDGINDIFRANQNSNPVVFKFDIYDRWGNLIFQSKSVFDGWDGTVNNKPAPFGVYYYIASFTMPDNKSSTKSGYVTLIR